METNYICMGQNQYGSFMPYDDFSFMFKDIGSFNSLLLLC